MAPSFLLCFVLLCTAVVKAAPESCYVRAINQIVSQLSPSWFACDNTPVQPNGATLCCMTNSTCSKHSICRTSDSSGGIPLIFATFTSMVVLTHTLRRIRVVHKRLHRQQLRGPSLPTIMHGLCIHMDRVQ